MVFLCFLPRFCQIAVYFSTTAFIRCIPAALIQPAFTFAFKIKVIPKAFILVGCLIL